MLAEVLVSPTIQKLQTSLCKHTQLQSLNDKKLWYYQKPEHIKEVNLPSLKSALATQNTWSSIPWLLNIYQMLKKFFEL